MQSGCEEALVLSSWGLLSVCGTDPVREGPHSFLVSATELSAEDSVVNIVKYISEMEGTPRDVIRRAGKA